MAPRPGRTLLRTWLPCSLLVLAVAASPGAVAARAEREPRMAATAGTRTKHTSDQITRFEMKNVDFHVDESIFLHLDTLRGDLLSRVPRQSPTFDDKRTLLLKIGYGEVAITPAALSELMNRYVFNYPQPPLTDIRVSIEDAQLKQEATLHKGVDIPVEMIGDLSVTLDGRIRFHPTRIKAAGASVKKLLDALGLEVEKLLKTNAERGVVVIDDDLVLDPNRMLPPPLIQGHVTAVGIDQKCIRLTFGVPAASRSLPPLDPTAPNYMYFRGGTLRFGKLTMSHADLQIVDEHPADPFDFFLDQYQAQLVAGHSQTMPNQGLVTFMPDYAALRERGRANGRSAGNAHTKTSSATLTR